MLSEYPTDVQRLLSTSHGCYQRSMRAGEEFAELIGGNTNNGSNTSTADKSPPGGVPSSHSVLVHAGYRGHFNMVEIVPEATTGSRGGGNVAEADDDGDDFVAALRDLAVSDQHVSLERVAAPCYSRTLWNKLVVNAVINPLTTILHRQNGVILDLLEGSSVCPPSAAELEGRLSHHRSSSSSNVVPVPPELDQGKGLDLITSLLQEVAAVCLVKSGGTIQLRLDDMLAAVRAVAVATKANWSSMVQDVWAKGVQSEIAAINGFVVTAGEQLGLPVESNRWVLECIRSLELRSVNLKPSKGMR